MNGCLTWALQEIQDLSSVSVPEHIDANRTARAAQEQRYPVKLTQYGLHLLMHFLQSAKLFQMLNIVNRRVDIQVTCFQGAASAVAPASVVITADGRAASLAQREGTSVLPQSAACAAGPPLGM